MAVNCRSSLELLDHLATVSQFEEIEPRLGEIGDLLSDLAVTAHAVKGDAARQLKQRIDAAIEGLYRVRSALAGDFENESRLDECLKKYLE